MVRPSHGVWRQGRQGWLLQLLLGLGQLLLQLHNLLFKAGDLLMPFAQLLEWIHQGVVIDRREGFHLVAAALRQAVAIGVEVLAVEPLQQRQAVLAVRLFPAFPEPLAAGAVVMAEFLIEALEAFGGQ